MIGYLLVASCGALSGTVTFGGRVLSDFGVSLFEMSIYRYSIGTLILLPFVWKSLYLFKLKWKHLIILGFVGATLGLSEVGAVVAGAPVSLVAFLLYTQPVWTFFLAWLFFRELPTKQKSLALIISFVGIIVLFKPWEIQETDYVFGALLGLFGGLLLSIFILLIRKTHFDEIPALVGTFGWISFSTFWFIIFYPIFYYFTDDLAVVALRLDLSLSTWLFIILFTMTAEVLPAIFLFKGSKTVEASISGIILLLEPISAAILAALFLGEVITGNILLGGMLILVANIVMIYKRTNVQTI